MGRTDKFCKTLINIGCVFLFTSTRFVVTHEQKFVIFFLICLFFTISRREIGLFRFDQSQLEEKLQNNHRFILSQSNNVLFFFKRIMLVRGNPKPLLTEPWVQQQKNQTRTVNSIRKT